jgi:hypothetical protein
LRVDFKNGLTLKTWVMVRSIESNALATKRPLRKSRLSLHLSAH